MQMLTNIEAKLEEYLAAIDLMPEDFVEVAEKQKEKVPHPSLLIEQGTRSCEPMTY